MTTPGNKKWSALAVKSRALEEKNSLFGVWVGPIAICGRPGPVLTALKPLLVWMAKRAGWELVDSGKE